jgi:hypothetical protein
MRTHKQKYVFTPFLQARIQIMDQLLVEQFKMFVGIC